MKVFLTSDTHGHIDRCKEIISYYGDFDMILHTGDYKEDGEMISSATGHPFYGVNGNCDGFAGLPYSLITLEGYKVLLTHGHKYQVNFSMDRLFYLAKETGANLVCFGHTHRAVSSLEDGIWFVNPGSLTEPRDGTGGTFAIVDIDVEGIKPVIVRYSTIEKAIADSKKQKPSGGRIRNMLNYSDRF